MSTVTNPLNVNFSPAAELPPAPPMAQHAAVATPSRRRLFPPEQAERLLQHCREAPHLHPTAPRSMASSEIQAEVERQLRSYVEGHHRENHSAYLIRWNSCSESAISSSSKQGPEAEAVLDYLKEE